MAGSTRPNTDTFEDQAICLPKTAAPGAPSGGALILQAALFYLEAAVIAIGFAVLAGSLAFSALAGIVKQFGIEQTGGAAVGVVIFAVVGATALAALVVAFLFYFKLLANPVAGRIVCALGSLLWALPVGILAPSLLKPIVPGYQVLVTWALYSTIAGLIYYLKRRVVRP